MKKKYGLYPGKLPHKPNTRGSQKIWVSLKKFGKLHEFPTSMGESIQTILHDRTK